MNLSYNKLNTGARIGLILGIALAINTLAISEASAQRGRGGGGAREGRRWRLSTSGTIL